MQFDVLVSLITLGLFIWAMVWSHTAFGRWETREKAKVRALEKIAASLAKQTGESQGTREPELTKDW
jgi:hypothetical protein